MAAPRRLFEPDVPAGLDYREEFITGVEEAELITAIASVAFADFEMRGVVARRRVAFLGPSYDQSAGSPLPQFLKSLRASAAQWAGVAPDAFAMALLDEYRPGAPIGWHRDAPRYGIVAGISLASACRMRFRLREGPGAVVAPFRDPRADAPAQVGLPDDLRVATIVRASHSAGGGVALLGDVSHPSLRCASTERRAAGYDPELNGQ